MGNTPRDSGVRGAEELGAGAATPPVGPTAAAAEEGGGAEDEEEAAFSATADPDPDAGAEGGTPSFNDGEDAAVLEPEEVGAVVAVLCVGSAEEDAGMAAVDVAAALDAEAAVAAEDERGAELDSCC